ncbi:MAG: DUF3604 domain-containing protein [Proteobacteria bacterium]|nr:DUF3604 domain-containing protein [Pseudomonadota bacterium]
MRSEHAYFIAWFLLISSGCQGSDRIDDATQPQAPALIGAETIGRCNHFDPARQPLFGDLHVHTSYSFDAYLFGTRNDPDTAYEFARGKAIGLPPYDQDGNPTRSAKLDRPLDFAAATDHSEFLGEVSMCTTPDAIGYDSLTCQTYRASPLLAFALWGARGPASTDPERFPMCGVGGYRCTSAAARVWRESRDAANRHYDTSPDCAFTSLIGYEWTGTPGGSNLHRNVIFANDLVPSTPTSYFEQSTANGLWTELRAQCGGTESDHSDCDVLAIPHNSNASNGRMFTPPETLEEAELRSRLEPLVEIIQHKGASECSPEFSMGAPDELCDFELINEDAPLCTEPGQPQGCRAPNNYLRNTLGQGLIEEQLWGRNPFQLGVIASTDTHNASPGNTAENTYQGHVGTQDANPNVNTNFSPGGLAVVWAEENSRPAIFAALARRETYGTSGTRPIVRFFAGWDYPADLCERTDLVEIGYRDGVPMGGTLPRATSSAPSFVAWAARDPGTPCDSTSSETCEPNSPKHRGTPLQRIQLIKVWLEDGEAREQVYDIAGNPDHSAGVDTATCQLTGPDTHDSLCSTWSDPDFDPNQPALYYLRVLENPSCRWQTYKCVEAGIDCDGYVPTEYEFCCDADLPATVQERAWTSPIWYAPQASTESRGTR